MAGRLTAGHLLLREAVVVHLNGELTEQTATTAAESLRGPLDARPAPGLLVVDLREVVALTSAGARVLLDLGAAAAARDVPVHLVVEPAGAVAQVMDAADPRRTMPRFAVFGEALASLTTMRTVGEPGRRRDPEDLGVLVEQFDKLARTLLDTTCPSAALRQVIDATALAVHGADLVSVTLRAPDGELSTPVETDPVAVDLDRVQFRSGRGPSVDATRPDAPGYAGSGDLTTDRRWPEFAAAAVGHGFRSVLATELFSPSGRGRRSGALTMYSRHPDGFTAADHNAALLLATYASLALARTQAAETADAHQSQLLRAIDTRDVIGQAKGILMNRQGIDAEQAFTLLRETSQELNVKLVDLARTIADHHADLHRP